MNRQIFRTSLISAALLTAFGVARADTTTSVTVPNDRIEPKCTDAANTVPAGCMPSAPSAGSSTSSTTSTDINAQGTTSSANPSLTESRTLDASPATDQSSGNSASPMSTNQDQSSSSASMGSSAQQPDTGSSSTQQKQ